MNARVRGGGSLPRLIVALGIGATLAAAVLVFTRTELLSLRYEHERLAAREAQLRSAVEKLRLEEAALLAPERIEPRARELGLRDPQPGQVIRLERSAEVR